MDYRAEIMSLEERNPSGCQGALVPGIIAKGKGPKFIVFGLNPAEAKDDKEEFYGTEFYIFDPEKSETLSQRRWSKKLLIFCQLERKLFRLKSFIGHQRTEEVWKRK